MAAVGLVERHLVEDVVRHVGAPDLVVEEVEYAVRKIDGRQRPPHTRPLVGAVQRHGRIGVLQPRVGDEPRLVPHQGTDVPQDHRRGAVLPGGQPRRDPRGEYA